MAEGSYEYACMRAELLNIEKPDKETFMQQLREKEALLQQEEDLEIQKLVVSTYLGSYRMLVS